MTTMFVVCAVFGGTILVLQTIMALIGLGGEALHTDVPHDVGHDLGADLHADAADAADAPDSDVLGHVHGFPATSVHADAPGHAASHESHAQSHGHGSSRLFAKLSFRGVVAAMAFFGIGGWTAEAAELPMHTVLLIAAACGGGALYGVYWLMLWLGTLRAEGTVRIGRAVGLPATVYLRIPPARCGAGKIHLNLQNRTMEYEAVTAGDALPTGARVVVVGVVNSDTVEVGPLPESEGDRHE